MSDFDFDELDKAVAGVLNTSPASADGVTSQSSASIQSAPSTPSAPVQSSQAPEAQPSVTSQPSPAPAARRSTGRFMDVVHPSSDMRTGASPLARSTTAPSFITPVSQAPEAEVADDAPKKDLTPEEEFEASWSAPLESPFLPDAKVEKRPLGSAEPTGAPGMASGVKDEVLLDELGDMNDQPAAMPDPIDFATGQADSTSESEEPAAELDEAKPVGEPVFVEPLDSPRSDDTAALVLPDASEAAPELDEYSLEELNAIESRNLDLPVPEEGTEPEELNPTAETVAPPLSPTPTPMTTPSSAPAPVATRPTSITQQYEEKPPVTQPSGAIYDTETYHRPVTPEAVKSHGVWSIVWIILLVILGAGAGVAFYLFVLPML